MKTFYNFLKTVFLFVLLFAIHLGSGIVFANQNKFSNAQNQHPDTIKYIPGVITIKVKEGIGPFEAQKSNVNMGINSLDQLMQKYSVNGLDKRFRHKPIPERSGLPALDCIYKIEFPEEMNVFEVVKAFAADPNVEYAEPVYLYYLFSAPNDSLYDQQQFLPQIMAEEAWDVHKGEDGDEEVVVAIVDTGTDWLHPDLTENTWQNLGEDADGDGVTLEFNNGVWERDPDDLNGIDDDNNGFVDDVIGWDFGEAMLVGDGSNPDPYPEMIPHGTHCTGIAAARTNNGVGISSISYNVKYMPINVNYGGWPAYGNEGVIYAAENGADIISISWGSYYYSQADAEVIEYALGLGSIVVAAAGNGNSDIPGYPASYPGVVSVAAVTETDSRAVFSSYGASVDIAVPGVNILSTLPNNIYESWDGTSMAAPMAAGLFALVKSYHPDWTNDQLISQVIGTADNIDLLNPGYENLLGYGRINAYHALVDENVTPPQELKLALLSYSINDENGDGKIEPGESVSISLNMRNYAQFAGNREVTFTVSSPNQDITLTSNPIALSILADDEFEITDAIEFTVNTDASCSELVLQVQASSDTEILTGQVIYIHAIIAPSGIFVFDGIKNGPGHSGSFIAKYLEEQGLDVLHSNIYPDNFDGFDAVFLSFANVGFYFDKAIEFKHHHSEVIQEYLENGGKVYLEGAPVMFMPKYFGWPNKSSFFNLFGVSNVNIDFNNPYPINSLEGQDSTLAEGIEFTESNQIDNWWIDHLVPAPGAQVPFHENGQKVSIYKENANGSKAFFFGYSLADLVDAGPHSSRYHLMNRILDLFGYSTGENYVVANFTTDLTDVMPGEDIQFTDWSFGEVEAPVIWKWDFDEDGNIDSEEQNPVWSYDAGGNYDIMLIVSSGQSTDTLIRKDAVIVRSGIFVFEGEKNGVDQSGAFIRDYLQDNGYDVVYSNRFPNSLSNFDAVFASFGSKYYNSPKLTDEIANTIIDYWIWGGYIYLEGSQALGLDQAGNNFNNYFGIEQVDNGNLNAIDMLQGQDGSIMEGMEFNFTNQFDVNSIDKYQFYENPNGAHVAFEESAYGSVAIQYESLIHRGPKTFCLSYTLANLEDSDYPNTREELLNRLMEFFGPTTGESEQVFTSKDNIKLYPNPASSHITLAFELQQQTELVVELYDFMGRKMLNYPKNLYYSGKNEIRLNTESLTSGTYFYRIISKNESYRGKLLIVR